MRCNWETLYENICNCNKCGLCTKRNHVVVGMGDAHADVMLIGEGPGQEEDRQGLPFVGNAGKLLDKMLAAIDIKRDRVYIANVVKCRPENNRTPNPDEALACLPYLRDQTALVSPKIIVCMGATAVRYVLGEDFKITRDRGKWVERNGIFIMPTYHPAALLYDEKKKREAWADLKELRRKMIELNINIFEETP